MKPLCVVLWCLLASGSCPQISEEQAMSEAMRFAQIISPGAYLADHRIWLQTDLRGLRPVKRYSFIAGRVHIQLSGRGEFEGFMDLSDWANKPKSGGEKFKTDAEAWHEFESLLQRLDVPKDLTVRKLNRVTAPFAYSFVLRPQPYGFDSQGGDSVDCLMQRVTGRVIMLRVSRGWTYEPPNVKITEKDAIEMAFQTFGVKEQKWACELKYWAVGNPEAPQELREMYAQKVIRLHYLLSRGYEHQSLLVDSVTGRVVDSGNYAGGKGLGEPRNTESSKLTDNEGNSSAAEGPPATKPTNPWYAAVVPIVAFLVVILIWYLGGRTSRNA